MVMRIEMRMRDGDRQGSVQSCKDVSRIRIENDVLDGG